MGVDVSHAYAAEEGVRTHQRTLMLSREEYGAQLVDVFDLAAARPMRYAFHSPFAPEFFGGGARLGPMLLTVGGASLWPTPSAWSQAPVSRMASGSCCSPIPRPAPGDVHILHAPCMNGAPNGGTMEIRAYAPDDLDAILQLFYDTVHTTAWATIRRRR